MKLSEQIHHYVDSHEERLDENFFKAIKGFMDEKGIGNAEQRKVKQIQKHLTKQIWSRFFLFKKRRQAQLKVKGYNILIMDKKFFDDFMKSMDVDAEIKKQVYKEVLPHIKRLEALYLPYQKKQITDEQMYDLLDRNKEKLSLMSTEVVNAIALSSTIKYLDQYLDTDLSGLPDGVLRSGLKSLRGATSSFAGHMVDAIANRAGSGGRKA